MIDLNLRPISGFIQSLLNTPKLRKARESRITLYSGGWKHFTVRFEALIRVRGTESNYGVDV